MTRYVERLDVIVGLYKIPCSSSGSMPFRLSFPNFVIHSERSELRLSWAMKENNDDHLWPCITMYFERRYAVYMGLYKLPCSSSGCIPCILSFLNLSFHMEIWISFTLSHESHQMKELVTRWSHIGGGRVPSSGSRTLGNRTMVVDRSVVHAPFLDKSMERPQSSHVSPSVGPNQLVASVKVNDSARSFVDMQIQERREIFR